MKIKENITKQQFLFLISHIKEDEKIRKNRKKRLLGQFALLYHTGLRVNETTQLTHQNIHKIITNQIHIIYSTKQKKEKKIYITETGAKYLKKIFTTIDPSSKQYIFKSERGSILSVPGTINDINTYLKKVFGKESRITSHSFRQTIISDMANSGINTSIIQHFIGHTDIKTTFRYIKTSDIDIIKKLNIVR